MSIILARTAEAAWDIGNFEGRDYVTTDSFARFYGFSAVASDNRNILAFKNDNRSARFQINSRVADIDGVKVWLAFPVIERGGKTYISRMDLGKTLEPALRPEEIPDLTPVQTIILDAGHGGEDTGAFSPYAFEKDFTLDLARRVRNRLQNAGFKVVMTRTNDVTLSLEERARIANRHDDSIFVSLHFNATENPAAEGFEIFTVTPRGAPSTEYEDLRVRDLVEEKGNDAELQSFGLALSIFHAMHGTVPMFDRGIKRARFAVLRLSKRPSVLVEGGFLSNRMEAQKIANTEWRDQLADSISVGIMEYKRLAERKTPPKLVADYRTARQLLAGGKIALRDVPLQEKNDSLDEAGRTQ